MIERSVVSGKPVLDEQSFTQLLAAAYLLQQEQERLRIATDSEVSTVQQIRPGLHQQQEEIPAPPAAAQPGTELCRACAHEFLGNEIYCAVCGASRASGQYPGAELQSKWATLWERHLIGVEEGKIPVFRKAPPTEAVPHADRLPFDLDSQPLDSDVLAGPEPAPTDIQIFNQNPFPADEPIESSLEPSPWNSADRARAWLDSHQRGNWWNARYREVLNRPGDLCLALASLVLLVTLGWALSTHNQPALASAQPAFPAVKRRPRPQPPKLSLMEKALVAVGLAVPPPAPAYMGDPDVKVWEDLQTGLYYCPNADLYGTTPKGRYTTQGEAQLDAFEPALRRPCD